MNRLSNEKSAYLKHAAAQKIDWYPWSEEAFKIAKEQDKPLFLSSGAVWCHWCHVMAQECFYDKEIAQFLNENFICIKLDRDERPCIDRRYQLAVSAMGAGGGWPLSVFLTHDKKPFYGGTYFPPEDKLGRPGLKRILRSILDIYKTKRDEISEYSEKVLNAIMSDPLPKGIINETQVDNAVKAVLAEFDEKNGGFGSAPKFPMFGAIDLMINRYYKTRDKSVAHCINKTLTSMALGGIYDQVGGGFHRYSTDEAWIVPHFEKMAEDNAWLLRNYLNAYAVFGDGLYKNTARGIISFILKDLSSPEGGFYSSQDADIIPDDEGGYFTWTEQDFRKILTEEEYEVLSLHLLDDAGSMHHDATKKVLFAAMNAEEIAGKTGRALEEVINFINNGKKILLIERNKREAPFIDKTMYTSINGMLISSFFQGFRILKDDKLKHFALKSLENMLEKNINKGELYHTENVKGLLEDYVYLVEALIAAYEVTSDTSFVNKADGLMEICIEKLWDKDEAGFFDTDEPMLGMKIKSIQDSPHPSANSVAIILLLKLHAVTGKGEYIQYAEEALKAFSTSAEQLSIHSGYFFTALDAYFNSIKLNICTAPGDKLVETALSLFVPYLNISYGKDEGQIIACSRERCYEPLRDTDSLKKFFCTGTEENQ